MQAKFNQYTANLSFFMVVRAGTGEETEGPPCKVVLIVSLIVRIIVCPFDWRLL